MASEIKIDFRHRQSAHCESGVAANLVSHYGPEISEAMAFGLGAGLFFGYIPFIKLNHLPLTTFRAATGLIFKRAMKGMGVKVTSRKFRSPEKAMDALDAMLDQGIPVGLQTGAWWLPYFPPAYRFHFNMHNLIVFGVQDGQYLISDPVFQEPVVCPRRDLMLARFAKGPLPPKGKMYYLAGMPPSLDLRPGIRQGIKSMTRAMLKTPLPIIGVRGIRFLAKRLLKWPRQLGPQKAALYLGQVVRMQEEIGTGGAGFRFIYAAFLQEAASILENGRLEELSKDFTLIGDRWREFAVVAARICKQRAGADDTYETMAAILRDCADREEQVCLELADIVQRPSQ